MVFDFEDLDALEDHGDNKDAGSPSEASCTVKRDMPQKVPEIQELDLHWLPLPSTTSNGDPLTIDLGWWGGALGSDGWLYCAPYGSNAVLRITTTRNKRGVRCELLPSPHIPQHKERFRNPVQVSLSHAGGHHEVIVCVPSRSETVLQIEPSGNGTPQISSIGNTLGAKLSKWMGSAGAAISPDGREGAIVYGLPYSHTSVLRIDIARQRCDLIGDFGSAMYKYWGGVVGADGAIYCPPYAATRVLRIGPEDADTSNLPTCELVGADFGSCARTNRKFKWMGGVAAGDGCIFGVPYDAECVLRIDTKGSELIDTLPLEGLHNLEAAGPHKWTDGILAGDGAIYCIPHKARRVLRIDCKSGRAIVVGPDLGPEESKWMGGVLGPDGCIYGVPQNARVVLRIRPAIEGDACRVDTFGDVGHGEFKWRTGVQMHGKIIFLPFGSKHVVWFEPTAAA